MNKQVNYIIYAMLLSLSLLIGYFFIDKIASTKLLNQNQSSISDTKIKKPIPPMSESVVLGKTYFNNKCAPCHQIHKDDPSILGFEQRGPWSDRQNLYSWVRNPEAFMKNDKYTQELKARYGSTMLAFPDLSDMEIDAIVDYINYVGESR
ncbi:MAG: cytochrome c [Chitinophagaceae bacterium]|nr:cytochrome c [Chitinophagaceae bacterium]